jgi:hypothetical protein
MSEGKPWHWEHYYEMMFVDFLILMEFYKDKQDEMQRQRELNKLKNQV